MEQNQENSVVFGTSRKETRRKLRVLIADDHKMVGEVVANFLTTSGDFKVDLAETLDNALDSLQAAGSYDIVMLDLVMPGMQSTSEIGKIVEAAVDGKVVLFTSHVDRFTMVHALELGVKGVIHKTMPARSLMSALRLVHSGEVFLPETVIKNSISNQKKPDVLTETELYILSHAAAGFTNKRIGDAIGLKEATIKMYMRSICSKLNARNRAHASIIGRDLGLIAR